ncbi:hypothetical protein D3C76_1857650 [compost metagenome]
MFLSHTLLLHYLIPVIEIPLIMCRWNNRKTRIAGMLARTFEAIGTAKSVAKILWNVGIPTGSVIIDVF